MRVLVVDDTQSVRERLAALIADIAGVDAVEQAMDGAQALASIAAHPPEVVVLDLQMPRVNGFGVLDSLHDTAPALITIVVSNHAEYRQHALQKGAAFFFDKSTQIDALIGTLGDLASGTRPPHVNVVRAWETVVVVEDDDAVRSMTRRVLEGRGYTVIPARHGAEAIDMCAAFAGPIHALLTDVVMPKMTGPQASALLCESRPGLRVLYMSGYTDDAIVSQHRSAERHAFLQKPFTPASLLHKVREVLDAH